MYKVIVWDGDVEYGFVWTADYDSLLVYVEMMGWYAVEAEEIVD